MEIFRFIKTPKDGEPERSEINSARVVEVFPFLDGIKFKEFVLISMSDTRYELHRIHG